MNISAISFIARNFYYDISVEVGAINYTIGRIHLNLSNSEAPEIELTNITSFNITPEILRIIAEAADELKAEHKAVIADRASR